MKRMKKVVGIILLLTALALGFLVISSLKETQRAALEETEKATPTLLPPSTAPTHTPPPIPFIDPLNPLNPVNPDSPVVPHIP